MKIPKRGERGFTLIELLIVVAILGVLAAVVIPNVGRFIGRGEEEAKDTEFANIQAAVTAMMVDNAISSLNTDNLTNEASERTNNMVAFPSPNGQILFGMNIGGTQYNYVATNTTAYWYTSTAQGTVEQYDTAAP